MLMAKVTLTDTDLVLYFHSTVVDDYHLEAFMIFTVNNVLPSVFRMPLLLNGTETQEHSVTKAVALSL